MPRHHKRLLGSRSYINYTPEKLEEALQKVADGTMKIREASRSYKIPFGTLYNKYKGLHGKSPGRSTVFSRNEEISILESAAKCSDWGFPLNILDIRMFAKYYLDRRGKNIAMFKNNLPGVDWVYSLLQRHKDSFGQRIATNIKKSRASVSKETMGEFFDNLERALEGLPNTNIFNYDETNVSDDPGKMRGIYRRGVKYPEKIMNHSKSATTIMVCGSADGTLLPPYVIYKSLHLYDTWKEGGPQGSPCCNKPCCNLGSRFNRTASGWLDGVTFRDWFSSCFLPHAKRLPGAKAIIGDNLSTHMDNDVLNMCAENDIRFICLVPNSTHLCQPLDVGFFRAMKQSWRTVLTEWKSQNPRFGTVPKVSFPRLLKKCLERMDAVPSKVGSEAANETSAIKRNLISAFRSAGIFPVDRSQVFKRFPQEDNEAENAGGDAETALVALLKAKRFNDATSEKQTRKKRLDVLPGRSVTTSSAPQPCSSGSAVYASASPQSSSSIANMIELSRIPEEKREIRVNVGQYILAKFCSTKGKKSYKYVCKVIELAPQIVVMGMKSIRKSKKQFKFIVDDISEINQDDILELLPNPSIERDQDGNSLYIFESEIKIVEV